MAHPTLTAKQIERLQLALIAHGFDVGPDGADGEDGPNTSRAVINARTAYKLDPMDQPVYDVAIERALGMLAIQDPAVKSAGNFLTNFIIAQLLKGTGINMDFAKVSKAIAAGITGAGLLGGQSAYGYISLPPDQLHALPGWVAVGVPVINAVIGFAVSFGVVYFAPANKVTP